MLSKHRKARARLQADHDHDYGLYCLIYAQLPVWRDEVSGISK